MALLSWKEGGTRYLVRIEKRPSPSPGEEQDGDFKPAPGRGQPLGDGEWGSGDLGLSRLCWEANRVFCAPGSIGLLVEGSRHPRISSHWGRRQANLHLECV